MKDASLPDPLEFIRQFRLEDAPSNVVAQAKLSVLDLLGIAIGGTRSDLSRIINAYVAEDFAGSEPLLFNSLSASPPGLAMATGMTIDALDGHDGYNPAKGHVGCALLAGILALAPKDCSGETFLEAIITGYEIGSRLGPALHATTPDYHTSGAWMAVAVAAVGARLCDLNDVETAHAVGIAEYYGPRSQMMRVIDHPSMLKDGSGWGAMAGVSAVRLAKKGFTGAPAITLTRPDSASYFADLGDRWLMMEQYYKPYPVCRWAHAPVEAALTLRAVHRLSSVDIARVEIETFHESVRLATNAPVTTDEAQYSTSFPVAIALAKGRITPFDLDQTALFDPEIQRLSAAMEMIENPDANAVFPDIRKARVKLFLVDGRALASEWHTPRWDATAPPTATELKVKFNEIAVPLAGSRRANAIADTVEAMPDAPLRQLRDLLTGPL